MGSRKKIKVFISYIEEKLLHSDWRKNNKKILWTFVAHYDDETVLNFTFVFSLTKLALQLYPQFFCWYAITHTNHPWFKSHFCFIWRQCLKSGLQLYINPMTSTVISKSFESPKTTPTLWHELTLITALPIHSILSILFTNVQTECCCENLLPITDHKTQRRK